MDLLYATSIFTWVGLPSLMRRHSTPVSSCLQIPKKTKNVKNPALDIKSHPSKIQKYVSVESKCIVKSSWGAKLPILKWQKE
jgi:hypothetical protein